MTSPWALFEIGGPTMTALAVTGMVLGFLLVERFLALAAQRRDVRRGRISPEQLAQPVVNPVGLRRMGLIRACIAISPLLGLLGTVGGMIETFQQITHGGYLAEMSHGISRALLTTQYGLAIAAPALVAERLLSRSFERLNDARPIADVSMEVPT